MGKKDRINEEAIKFGFGVGGVGLLIFWSLTGSFMAGLILGFMTSLGCLLFFVHTRVIR